MEEDGRLEMLLVAEAVGHLLDRLDLGVENFCGGIGDASGGEVVEHAIEMPLDHVSDVDDRLEARVCRPDEPLLVELERPTGSVIVPQSRQLLLDGPGAAGRRLSVLRSRNLLLCLSGRFFSA